MFERIIENWLARADERTYQIPFCQVLSAEGHRVLHISTHGMMEQGKDIITISPLGEPCGFQLKAGNITQHIWRQIKGEVDDLIELPIVHPGVPNQRKRRAILVVNGDLTDPIRRPIDDRNRQSANRRPRYPRLEVVPRGDLLKRFSKIHGEFFPSGIREFGLLIQLLAGDGRDLLPKSKMSTFPCSVLPLKEDIKRRPKARELACLIASSLILNGYILGRYQEAKNWLAVAEGWVLTVAHIAAVAEKYSLPHKDYSFSLSLCRYQINFFLRCLCEEVRSRQHFGEGDLMTEDPVVHRARITLTLGWIAARILVAKIDREPLEHTHELVAVVEQELSKLFLWSEAAVPCFAALALALETEGRSNVAESLVATVVGTICFRNGPRSQSALGTPYEPIEESFRREIGLPTKEIRDPKEFLGYSYCVEALTEMLARRLRKQAIRRLWPEITHLNFCAFIPTERYQYLLWRNKTGLLRTSIPKKPQDWTELRERAEHRGSENLPFVLASNSWMPIYFLLTYPHRFGTDIVALLDAILCSAP